MLETADVVLHPRTAAFEPAMPAPSELQGSSEGDYLEAFRLRHWGKRDLWAWVYGIVAPIQFMVGLREVITSLSEPGADKTGLGLLMGILLLASAGVGAMFWTGQPMARVGVLMIWAAQIDVELVMGSLGSMVLPVFSFGLTIAILSSTRNKLFFMLDVTREQLQKSWAFYDHGAARYAWPLGLVGLLFPLCGPLALACGVLGLPRGAANPDRPRWQKGAATAGIILGGLSTAWWWVMFPLLLVFWR